MGQKQRPSRKSQRMDGRLLAGKEDWDSEGSWEPDGEEVVMVAGQSAFLEAAGWIWIIQSSFERKGKSKC